MAGPGTIVLDRGAVFDDLVLDFGDSRGPIGFARMTDYEREILRSFVPRRTVIRLVAGPRGAV